MYIYKIFVMFNLAIFLQFPKLFYCEDYRIYTVTHVCGLSVTHNEAFLQVASNARSIFLS